MLVRERDSAGTVHVKQFYIRRILRIWPLYYFALGLAVLISLLSGAFLNEIPKLGWFAIFAAAWYLAFHATIHLPITPLWSISVEEQFYLFAPWTIKFVPARAIKALCIALIVASNLWLFYLAISNATTHRIWFDTLVHFECFAAGILLSSFLSGRLPKFSLPLRFLMLITAFAMWFFSVYPWHIQFDSTMHPGVWHLMAGYSSAAIGSVLIILAFLGVDAKFLPRWAIYLGRISFGLYVYHEIAMYITDHFLMRHLDSLGGPVLIAKLALQTGLTVLMAAISYRYLETPFLRAKRRHTPVESRPKVGV